MKLSVFYQTVAQQAPQSRWTRWWTRWRSTSCLGCTRRPSVLKPPMMRGKTWPSRRGSGEQGRRQWGGGNCGSWTADLPSPCSRFRALHWVTIQMLCVPIDEEIPEVSDKVVNAITGQRGRSNPQHGSRSSSFSFIFSSADLCWENTLILTLKSEKYICFFF